MVEDLESGHPVSNATLQVRVESVHLVRRLHADHALAERNGSRQEIVLS